MTNKDKSFGSWLKGLFSSKGSSGPTSEQGSSLIAAASSASYERAKQLLDNNANPNEKDSARGWTALMWACYNGDKNMVFLLLYKGADPNVKNSQGSTAVMLAASEGHRELIEMLYARGANINERTDEGFTALLWASEKGHKPVVSVLDCKWSKGK